MGLIQKFKNLFFKPDVSDQERIDRWHREVEEANRLKELHRKSRKLTNKKKSKPVTYSL
jgi:hypothetical protein